eukprot:CAMPEP_0113494428 /NCGR_PEP_ID=MMETSP0014_2-20120614/29101_1 /TAXON_ID=2857 /ORGANISM="Nitzschia sp." /LENGTH=44 /DNA_ID=CAMNT_0000388319 /DNA_START=102 /DNA_END=233 /DNA_ORIENTATION=+ /assembly_acc=CAM_ASM_000159
MKFTALVFLAAVAGTSAFAPTASTSKNSNVVLNAEAEQSRKAFL